MSSHLSNHQKELAATLNTIESIGGIRGLFELSKTRIEFQKVVDKKGFDICRMVATMHLDELEPVAYAFAIDAMTKSKDIALERPGFKGGRMPHAFFIKELSENYRNNPQLQSEAETYALRKLGRPLANELLQIKNNLADPGFPGVNPFKSNNSEAKTRGILDRIMEKVHARSVNEESTMSL